ncbi:glycosyltransferase family 4 protein [Spongisporangium articulatum]|uniref:Glycosyltransferase family 4 protein n=1 Tax=Spongisporangium articulatum TaxID=3362603 RepID=A0ABW8ASJ5_9ACTN
MPEGARRVLLVAGHATGGIGAHVASLARGLPETGWAPTVFTSALTASRFDFGAGAMVVTGWSGAPSALPRTVRALRRRALRADVVHAHGHQAGLLATATVATIPRARRPKVVVSWHNAVLPGARLPTWPAALWAQRWQARHADLVTGASSDLVGTAEGCGARAAQLAPVAAQPFRPGTRTERADGRRVVLTVSRLARQKNLESLVLAAEQVAKSFPGFVWQVAGDGDEEIRHFLEQVIEDSQAPVELLGARDDVPDLLASADVFVLPSLWEARSLAVQEAMGAGLPIVATDVGGLPDLVGIDGQAGVLVPIANRDRLATAVLRILEDPAFGAALGAEARRRYDRLPTERDVQWEWATRYGHLVEG